MEIYKVNLCIEFKCGKVRSKLQKSNTFQAVDERTVFEIVIKVSSISVDDIITILCSLLNSPENGRKTFN